MIPLRSFSVWRVATEFPGPDQSQLPRSATHGLRTVLPARFQLLPPVQLQVDKAPNGWVVLLQGGELGFQDQGHHHAGAAVLVMKPKVETELEHAVLLPARRLRPPGLEAHSLRFLDPGCEV